MPDSNEKDFWNYTYNNYDGLTYRERWKRDNPILKQELMQIAHNYDPLFEYRHLTRNATNFGSKNSWYTYMRTFKYTGQDEYTSWIVEVHPTAENKDKPYHKPHHTFEVMMPEEFLNGELFMAENIKPHWEGSKTTLLRQRHIGLEEKNEYK